MTRPSSQGLRSRAQALAARANHSGTPEYEAAACARQLARLIDEHPEWLSETEEEDDDPVDVDIIDKLADVFIAKAQSLDLRPKCEVCLQRTPKVWYGKCAACIKAASEARRKRNPGYGR